MNPNDNNKRAKLIFITLVISGGVFLTKLFQPAQFNDIETVLLTALVYALISYIGMLWAFEFQVTKKSLLVDLLQASMFIFLEIVFIDFYFLRKFTRFYEVLFLFLVILQFTGGTYVSLLVANVFNVANFKHLPLQQAAKTFSYVLTLLMIYFMVFSVLSAAIPLQLAIFIIIIGVIGIISLHLTHLSLSKAEFWLYMRQVTGLIVLSILPIIFYSSRVEMVALVPTVMTLVSLGYVMNKSQNIESKLINVEYSLMIIGVYAMVYLIK